jgi:hypothetical protein
MTTTDLTSRAGLATTDPETTGPQSTAPAAVGTGATGSAPERTVTARRRAAVATGTGLLAMAAVAVPANAVLQPLMTAPTPEALSPLLADGAGTARVAVLGFVAVVVLDLLVAWGLARFLERDTPALATLSGWLRVGYAAMLGAAVLRLGEGVRAGADDPAAALSGMQGFAEGWRLSLLVFGVHLVVTGAALLRTAGVPRWLAVAVGLSGVAYVADTVVRTLLADPAGAGTAWTVVVAVVATVGELGLAVWLLVRGRRS